MNCVDWSQAAAYCSSVGTRLPTEQEWEAACSGAEHLKFPYGAALEKERCLIQSKKTKGPATYEVTVSRDGKRVKIQLSPEGKVLGTEEKKPKH